ncbi:MAG: hypothetical protein AMXMBFR84_32970 [Candidatus Hydrogenedentota bacterium]
MGLWPSDAFKKGVASSIVVFALIVGVALYFIDQIYKLKDEQRQMIETELTNMTTRADDLSQQLAELISQKWREKYEAERLQVETLSEEASLIRKQYEDQIKELTAGFKGTAQPDTASLISGIAQLRREKEILVEKLELANSELSRLREIYTKSPSLFLPSGGLEAATKSIHGTNSIEVKRGEGWSSPDGIVTFGVEGISVNRARPGISASHNADVKVFGERQKAQAGSTFSKEIEGQVYRVNVIGINATDQTVTIVYAGPVGNPK